MLHAVNRKIKTEGKEKDRIKKISCYEFSDRGTFFDISKMINFKKAMFSFGRTYIFFKQPLINWVVVRTTCIHSYPNIFH